MTKAKSKIMLYDKEDLKNVIKVFGYLVVSGALTELADLLPQLDLGENKKYVLIIINLLLVALKKLLTGKNGFLKK